MFAGEARIANVFQRAMGDRLIPERRSKVRFPLTVHLRYRLRGSVQQATGDGKSVNISSIGMLFTAEHELRVGERLELTLDWPAPLDGVVPLRLFMFGRIVRADGPSTAVKIDHHEFRTTRRSNLSETSKATSSSTG